MPMATVTIVAIVVVVAVLAIGMRAVMRRLQHPFGPEYDQLVGASNSKRKAESILGDASAEPKILTSARYGLGPRELHGSVGRHPGAAFGIFLAAVPGAMCRLARRVRPAHRVIVPAAGIVQILAVSPERC